MSNLTPFIVVKSFKLFLYMDHYFINLCLVSTPEECVRLKTLLLGNDLCTLAWWGQNESFREVMSARSTGSYSIQTQ